MLLSGEPRQPPSQGPARGVVDPMGCAAAAPRRGPGRVWLHVETSAGSKDCSDEGAQPLSTLTSLKNSHASIIRHRYTPHRNRSRSREQP